MEATKPRILIVDDASNWRTTLETLLKSYGYAVTVAATVLEASEALRGGPYAAAILDVRLDAFDDDNHEGVATVLATAHHQFPKMSFIVISSYYNEADVRSFAPRDAKLFYFDKNNFSIDQLLMILHRLVEESAC
jgi:DNA-binding NtrC family response regulator